MAVGRRVYGLAAILIGIVGLVFRHWGPGHVSLLQVLNSASDVLLILGGAAINLGRRLSGCAALALAAVFAISAGVQLAPALPHAWKVWVTWQGLAEPLAMSMGGLLAWSLLGKDDDPRRARVAGIAMRVFGLCLLVFGVSHFVYLKFTASLVPAWLPPSQAFWAYATGVAHIAAGLAILSGVRARLAAILLTAMFVIFGLLVHLPSVIRDPHSHANWSENGVNLALVGAAWCVADWLRRREGSKPRAARWPLRR